MCFFQGTKTTAYINIITYYNHNVKRLFIFVKNAQKSFVIYKLSGNFFVNFHSRVTVISIFREITTPFSSRSVNHRSSNSLIGIGFAK